MRLLTVLEFPDPRLRQVAEPIKTVDDTVRQLIDAMFETMYTAPGIGLAATQINVHKRLLIADVSDDQSQPVVLINPELTVLDEDKCQYDEGCLSIPGFYETVSRPKRVRVTALDRFGKPLTLEPEGLLAVCLQHEIDHLDGKLFVDYISTIKRDRIRLKLKKRQRAYD